MVSACVFGVIFARAHKNAGENYITCSSVRLSSVIISEAHSVVAWVLLYIVYPRMSPSHYFNSFIFTEVCVHCVIVCVSVWCIICLFLMFKGSTYLCTYWDWGAVVAKPELDVSYGLEKRGFLCSSNIRPAFFL